MPRPPLNVIVLGLAVVVAALATALVMRGRGGKSGTGVGADAVGDRHSVAALGRLAPQGGVIDVGGATGERIDRLAVSEGDRVKSDQELAFLGSYPLRLSEKQLAEAQLAEAKARQQADQAYGAAIVAEATAAVDQLKLVDLDVEALRAKIASLELKHQIATRDQERLEGAGSDVISQQELDHQKLVVEQAKAELNSTRAQLARLEASRDANAREAQAKLETAKANQLRLANTVQLESLEKGLVAADQKLRMAVVRAPREGRVLRIVTRAGETIGQRPILQLGDTDHMYAVAEIYETDVRHVRPGQRAQVTSAALMEPLAGTVEKVGVTVAKNEVVSLEPTASADARVVAARIRLDDSREASGLVDLQVDVLIDTDGAEAADKGRAPISK